MSFMAGILFPMISFILWLDLVLFQFQFQFIFIYDLIMHVLLSG